MSGTALIGLGNMGRGMARNIMAAGVALRGSDLSDAARDGFAADGGAAFGTAQEAATGCDLVIVMVQNAAQARAVLFDAGVAGAMRQGGTVMLCSTVAPSEARALAADLDAAGLLTLDAPVSGGQKGAEAGTLTVMASGPEAAFARAQIVLDAIGGKVLRLGDEAGIGATYKVVHQLAAGVHLAAAAELMALGVSAGCDAETLFDIVTSSAGQSWMLEDRGPRMMQADPQATSTVDIFVKDVGLVLQTGREVGLPLPLSSAAFQMFQTAAAMGLGTKDDSKVVAAYEALSGKPVYKD